MSFGAVKIGDVTWYQCRNCGLVQGDYFRRHESMRPNSEFCDQDCMALVLRKSMQCGLRRPAGYKEWLAAYDNRAANGKA